MRKYDQKSKKAYMKWEKFPSRRSPDGACSLNVPGALASQEIAQLKNGQGGT